MKKNIQLLIIFPIIMSIGIMQEKANNLQVLDFESAQDLKKYMKVQGQNHHFVHLLNLNTLEFAIIQKIGYLPVKNHIGV